MSIYKQLIRNSIINRYLRRINLELLLNYLDIDFEDKKGELYAKCPNPDHLDLNPSWSINNKRDDQKYGRHYCFSCGYGGDILTLVMTVKELSFDDSKKWIERTFFRNKDEETDAIYEFALKEKNKVDDEKEKYFENCELPKNYKMLVKRAKRYYDYVINRGIVPKIIRKFEIGYCESGYYSNRIIVPIYFNGVLYSFFARSILKYINKNKKGLYPKGSNMGSIIWPIENINNYLDYFMIVEGPFDVLRLLSLGYENVFCAFGNKITDDQVNLMYDEFKGKKCILIPDSDGKIEIINNKKIYTKGKLMIKHGIEKLKYKFDTYLLKLPVGRDPGDVDQKIFEIAFKNVTKLNDSIDKKIVVNYSIKK